jgi:hypothetical protein
VFSPFLPLPNKNHTLDSWVLAPLSGQTAESNVCERISLEFFLFHFSFNEFIYNFSSSSPTVAEFKDVGLFPVSPTLSSYAVLTTPTSCHAKIYFLTTNLSGHVKT